MKNDLDENYIKKMRELELENQRLRAELRALKEERAEKDIFSSPPRREKTYQIYLRHVARREKLFSQKNFASYLVGSLKTRSFFLYYQRLIYIVKKYTFITTTLKILAFVFAIIQSSALFVLFTGTVAVTAPITVIFSYLALTLTFFGRKRLNRRMTEMLAGKKITVFFPPKERAFERDSYFRFAVSEAAASEQSAVVIVSPFYFSNKGFSDSKRYYLATRRERENVILLRKHYYFTFRKHVLSRETSNTTFVF